MYQVSAAYKTALSKPAKVRRLTGYVGAVPFTDENISSGSFMIENKCADGKDITFGYAYMSSLTCVFRNLEIDSWENKVITVSEGLLIDAESDTWEDVPLGIYNVNQADRREDGLYIVAFDNFQFLDKDFPTDVTTGTPYDLLLLVAQKCGITLAQTEEEIRALPNGTQALALYADNGIETYRQFVSWVAQAMGCFAVMNREGKLELRLYGNGTGDAVDTIRLTDRWKGSSFSEFSTKYTGISVVQIEDESVVYKGMSIDDGLTYKMGSNPLLQNMSLDIVLTNLLNVLASIHYTPFTVSRSGAPHYDLGDVLDFPGGIGGGAVGCLMAFDYTYRGEYKMYGYGSNPALSNARNKKDSDISGLMSQVKSDTIQYYTYTNAEEYEIRDDYAEIISIRFGSSKQTLVTFQCEVKLESEIEEEDIDAVVGNIKYLWNNVELEYKPVETWIDGKHLLHLMYLIPIQEAAINTFKVRLNCDGGVIRIGRADLNAVISGQGLVASTVWDGWIECEDNITELTLADAMEVAAFVDECEIKGITPITIEIEDEIAVVEITNEPIIVKYGDAMYINRNPIGELTWYDVLYRVIPAANIYDPSVSYVPYDICYTLNGDAHIEWRCTAETTGEFDESCWEVRTYNTWGEVYNYYGW